jgi:elongation factor P
MINATQIRAGMTLLYNDAPHTVMTAKHVTPGKGNAVVQTRLRNIETGIATEKRFRSDEKVEKARLDKVEMEYLYSDGDTHHFMNSETYEQIELTSEKLGNGVYYLIANIKFIIEFYKENPIGVIPPKVVELKIIDTPPNLKGATATASPKPAKLETGLSINVPPFVEVGEVVRVDTVEGKYLERAK